MIIITSNSGEDPKTSELPGSSDTSLTELPTNESSFYVEDMIYDGGTYNGYVDKETRIPNGKGSMKYTDSSVYTGEWVDGVIQGNGKMIYKNGDVYDGEWKEGKKHGNGEYTWSDGQKYSGRYVDDMRDGYGVYSGWTGFVSTYGWSGTYNGECKANKFDGQGKFIFDNGDQFNGIFYNNEFFTDIYTRNDGSEYTISNGKPSL